MEHAAMVEGEMTWLKGRLVKIGENHGGPVPRWLCDGKLTRLDDRLC